MKVYIKSSYTRNELPRYQEWAKATKRDIRRVAKCDNQEELDACDIESWNPKSVKKIWDELAAKQNITDFDDKVDLILDWLYNHLTYVEEQIKEYSGNVDKADRVNESIERYLKMEGFDYSIQDDGFHVYTALYEDRDSLIAFIDDLLKDLGGKYFGTGRGGSWTSWNVKIDGIEYQVGPHDKDDCWLIREV